MTFTNRTDRVDQTPTPEPSTEDQVDIAQRVQKDLGEASENRRETETAQSDQSKATQFDGNPNAERADEDTCGPRDDSPNAVSTKEE